MAIELISKIKPKNNGNFKLVDAQDVEYNGKGLDEAIASGEFKGDKGDRGDVGPIGPAGPTGPKGDNGSDGYSPTVSVAEDQDGVTVTVHNKDGEQTAKVKNGKDYEHSEEFSALAEQVRADKESVEQSKTSVEQTVAQAEKQINSAGTIAIQGVQNEGTTQTEKVTVEGTKQITEIQSKGEEILHSFPQDFPTQMDTKLDKQQGTEHAGKALVIGEDGLVVPGEVQSSGGDGIAIVNTLSGASPLVIDDSSDRVIKGFGLTGKTDQMQTTGKNLFDIKTCPLEHNSTSFKIPISSGNVLLMSGYTFAENTQYTLSVSKVISEGSNSASFKFDYIDGTRSEVLVNNMPKKSLISTSGKTIKNVYIINPYGGSHEVFNLQVEEGTTATPYEPYTGGKPSPSPEFPQEIKSVGKWNEATQKYEVDVKITGKNLFDREKAKNENNWIFKDGDGYARFPIYVKKGSRITFSYTEKLPTGMGFYLGISQSETKSVVSWLYHDTTTSLINNKYTIVAENDYAYLMCTKGVIQKFLDTIQTLQLEISSVQTEYQPYKEQTISLSLDQPLREITDCKDNFSKDGILRKIRRAILNGSENWYKYENNTFKTMNCYGYKIDDLQASNYIQITLCNFFEWAKFPQDVISHAAHGGYIYFTVPKETYPDLESFKQWLSQNNIILEYISNEPILEPLSEEVKEKLQNISTDYPTTVISTDGGELDPDVEVTYTADTKNYIDNKFAQLQKSLVNTQIQLL